MSRIPAPSPVDVGDLHLGGRVRVCQGDSRDVLKAFPDGYFHAVVCDPPYALVSIVKRFGGANAAPAKEGTDGAYKRASAGFMGRKWDTGETAFAVEFWAEVWRVLKPGGFVIAASGTRTYHRLACAVEDAGFEIRDMLSMLMQSDTAVARFMDSLDDEQRQAFVRCIDESQFGGMLSWLYGSGFPKSHDVAKGIDRHLGAKREKVRVDAREVRNPKATGAGRDGTEGATRPWIEAALQAGYHEVDGDQPATEAAADWQGWGTALKPACEPWVFARKPLIGSVAENVLAHGTGGLNIDACRVGDDVLPEITAGQARIGTFERDVMVTPERKGRWPANVIHDGSDEVVSAFPESASGAMKAGTKRAAQDEPRSVVYGVYGGNTTSVDIQASAGSSSRFFYSAKADGEDRFASKHPTVKPVNLMQWLVRLVTPKGGVVLDPFAGSGTTGEAAWREGMHAVLIEREADYVEDIRRRMRFADSGPDERQRERIKASGKAQSHDDLPLFAPAGDSVAPPPTPEGRRTQDLREVRRPGRTIGPVGLKR